MTTTVTSTWFEIPAADLDRAIRFYETIFAVTLDRNACPSSGLRMGVFPIGDKGSPGAVIAGEEYTPATVGCTIYLYGGEDLAVPLNRVEAAGGAVLLGKTFINEQAGYMAIIRDTEGNRIGLHSWK